MIKKIEKSPTILWVDDDQYFLSSYRILFYENGYDVKTAMNASEAVEILDKISEQIDLVILDLRLPPGDSFEEMFSTEITQAGFNTGIVLGSYIVRKYPHLPLLGLSISGKSEIVEWFKSRGFNYLRKPARPRELISQAEAALRKIKGPQRKPKIFIVHGHDDSIKLELKNFLQNRLNLGEPIILHEQPNFGRTIIEKFEDEASEADIVFVLMTPDDLIADSICPNTDKRRARQNVIFELGYFYGILRRNSGKIILCHKGQIELPSDITGIIYIDVSDGIEAAGEEIRKELKDWTSSAS